MASEKKKFNQKEYVQKFNQENYERIYVRVPKGKKQIFLDAARAEGKSLNEFIVQCVYDKLKKEG